MNKFTLKYIKLNPNAKTPTYGSDFSAGCDLYALLEDSLAIPPHTTAFVKTGIAMEIPNGLVGLIYARSGLACKSGLAPANKVGVVDSDYRGEIMVALHNHTDMQKTILPFERIAQMVFTPYYSANFELTDNLEDSVRGEGGFGSTGKQ